MSLIMGKSENKDKLIDDMIKDMKKQGADEETIASAEKGVEAMLDIIDSHIVPLMAKLQQETKRDTAFAQTTLIPNIISNLIVNCTHPEDTEGLAVVLTKTLEYSEEGLRARLKEMKKNLKSKPDYIG